MFLSSLRRAFYSSSTKHRNVYKGVALDPIQMLYLRQLKRNEGLQELPEELLFEYEKGPQRNSTGADRSVIASETFNSPSIPQKDTMELFKEPVSSPNIKTEEIVLQGATQEVITPRKDETISQPAQIEIPVIVKATRGRKKKAATA